MSRLDRIMDMLLLLRDGRVVSATELAARFGISKRTVYRDLEMLSGLGAPVATEMGRSGGSRLEGGFFLPPVALDTEEATSLLLGLHFMRRLRVMPFPEEAASAERKLLAVLPERTREAVARARSAIGFERVPSDLLHPERGDPLSGDAPPDEAENVARFLRAALARARVRLAYRSPYREEEPPTEVEPMGLMWDRDRWYLVARPCDGGKTRMYRSDRVASIAPGRAMPPTRSDFDASALVGRAWLRDAMDGWREESPARIAMPRERAAALRRDWYYGNAVFEDRADGRVNMVYGEWDSETAAALLRWLGPGAELLEPAAWRPAVAAGLRAMADAHDPTDPTDPTDP